MALAQLLDRVEEAASRYRPRRAALATATLPFWTLGYTIGVLVRWVWLAGAWAVAALSTGYRDGRGGPR